MSIRVWVLAVVVLVLFAGSKLQAETVSAREHQIKAAFLYNFLIFVDWPQEKIADSDLTMTIGIIGHDKFKDAFEPVKDKLVNNRKVVINWFKGLEELKRSDKLVQDKEIEAIRRCHLLYICGSEAASLKEIMNLINGYNILTVASIENFVESDDGIIGFIIEQDKIRFEINNTSAKQANLKIRSQLLRLAKRVIGDESSEIAKR